MSAPAWGASWFDVAVEPAPPKCPTPLDRSAPGDSGYRHCRRFADRLHKADPGVAQPRPRRPVCLHPSPELVLETGAGARGFECVVELPLQRLELEVFRLAHTAFSFSTASFSAFTARW